MNDQPGAMERLLLRRDADGVAWLTLNRPPRATRCPWR